MFTVWKAATGLPLLFCYTYCKLSKVTLVSAPGNNSTLRGKKIPFLIELEAEVSTDKYICNHNRRPVRVRNLPFKKLLILN